MLRLIVLILLSVILEVGSLLFVVFLFGKLGLTLFTSGMAISLLGVMAMVFLILIGLFKRRKV